MPIKIKSKSNNFRRCGVAHSDQWVEHPDGTFTTKEIDILKKEPMLIVEEVCQKNYDKMNKAQLVSAMQAKGLSIPDDATKETLIKILQDSEK